MNALLFRIKTRIIAVLLLLCGFSLSAQKDMRGTDFWLTFGANWRTSQWDGVLELQIRIVSRDMPTSGTIYFTPLGTSIPFSVQPREVFTYKLTDTERDAVYNTSQGISNSSIRITCDYPITAYALNQYLMSADATNLLPVTALGTDYYYISYIPGSSAERDAYAVIATENNTKLYHIDRTTPIATLDAGQVYYKLSNTDMTGNHIFADKSIALFALNQGVYIPHLGTDSRDCLMQQLAPINTWGRNFFVPVSDLTTPWYNDTRDRVRVVASQNNTTITQSGGTLITNTGGQSNYTINAGQFIELEITLNNNGCYIQADKPIGVCTYLTSGDYNGIDFSDPSQAWLPAIEQTAYEAVIAPFIPSGYTNLDKHYALIITPTATKDSTTVKIGNGAEQALSGGIWRDHIVSEMSFYSMPLTNNTAYHITNWRGGLIVMGYATGYVESYYYLAFSSMRSLNTAFYANDVPYQNLSYEMICDQPIQFRAEIKGDDISKDTGYLKWYIDDVEEINARDQLEWSKMLAPGTYKIKMDVLMENNITVRTVEGTLKITSVDITNISEKTTICVGKTVNLLGTPSGGRWESVNHKTATVDSYGTVTGISAGNAEIRYIIEEPHCTDTASTVIKITNSTVNVQTTPEICERENGTITLTVNSEVPTTVKYIWEKRFETTPALTNLRAGTYKVIISDSFCVVNETITVEHIDFPVADFEFPDNVIFSNTFFITDLSKGTVQIWEWDMGDGTQQTGKNISHIYPKIGDYEISLKVTDTNECTDFTSKIIHIYDDLIIFIPNIFTPNGDGLNDTWKPEMLDYSKKGYQLSIFDRWGQRIFHTTDTEEAWDGTINGKVTAPNTIYSYQIIVQNVMYKEYKFTGHITLIR